MPHMAERMTILTASLSVTPDIQAAVGLSDGSYCGPGCVHYSDRIKATDEAGNVLAFCSNPKKKGVNAPVGQPARCFESKQN